jgi:hypothetical protein
MNFFLYRAIFLLSLVAAFSTGVFAQATNVQNISACHDCRFVLEQDVAFYDDGGHDGAVSTDLQTTTFTSDFRRGKKLSFYFTTLDLPAGASLEVHYKDFGGEEGVEYFTEYSKRANVIADEIRIVYVPAPNPEGNKGWRAVIEIFEPFNDQVANRPESDCPFAIPLCANQTVVALGGLYTNLGSVNDDSGTCYSGTGSGGSVWYSFTPLTSGPLDFRILPSNNADYDFVLWDITNGCGSGQRNQLSCNYSLYTGPTGMSGQLCNTNEGDNCGCNDQSKAASCNRFNGRINVTVGRKYAICINFFSGSNGGFTLQFQNEPGSVAITDNQPPQILNAFTSQCGSASQFSIRFSEFVQCSSINNGSFTLPGYTFNVTNLNCNDNRTNTVNFTVSPPLVSGVYNIGINNIRDLCDNSLNVTYTVDLSNPPTPSISQPVPVCRNPNPNGTFSTQPNQTLTASGGTTYEWSTGATGSSISVAPPSNTTYTVTAFRGNCAATASTSVEVRRAGAVTLGPDIVSCGQPITLTALPNVPGHNYQFFRGPATGPLLFNNGTSIQNGPNNTITVNPANNTRYRVIMTDLNGCRTQADVFIRVTNTLDATFNVPGNNFCLNGNPVPLSANPPGGTFTGPGVVGDQFFPNLAGIGDHTITYTLTNQCGTYSGTRVIRVSNGALPNIPLQPTYCVTDPAFNFNPTPVCGRADGPGIINNGACLVPVAWLQQPRFDPAAAGVGTHTITYSGQGCANTRVVTILPEDAPPALDEIGGPFCSTDSPVGLTAFPAGGTFSGPGVNGNTFSPAIAGLGSHTITYTVVTCSGPSSDFKTVQVVPGNASATISYAPGTYCASIAAPQNVTLTGTQGGTFSASPAGLNINSSTGAITPQGSTPNTYTVTYSLAGGSCGSFSTTASVTISNAIAPNFNPIAAICSGAAAPVLPGTSLNNIAGTWNPNVVSNTASGTYTFTPNAGQCATSTSIGVTVNSLVTPVFNAIPAICQGDAAPVLSNTSNNNISGTWNPALVSNTASGSYTFTPTPGQCASPITVDVTVNPANTIPLFDPIAPLCAGAPAPALPAVSNNSINGTWSPATISNAASGTYTFTPAAGQCAANATLSVTVFANSGFSLNVAICTGQVYTLPDGSTENTAGIYVVTIPNSAGCDSVITVNLSLINILNVSVNASICSGESYVLPDGSSVSSGGLYPVTLLSSGGCDSVVTTNLAVNPKFDISVDASICAGETFTLPDGSLVTTPGDYAITLSTLSGCDSIITTQLQVRPLSSSSINASICDGETYTLPDGSSVTTQGIYSVAIAGSNTCDSTITVNLTVNEIFALTVDAQICGGQSFTLPDGSSVSTSGTYPVTLTSVNGCDSVVTTDLSVISVLTTSVDASICNGSSYTLPDGSVVTAAGLYDVTLTSSGGCDSIITTNLSILPIFNLSADASICAGDSFTLPDGSSVSTSGQYAVTLTSSAGCDSTVTTNLSVSPILNSTVAVSICQGESYFAGGADQTTSGSYLDVFTGSNGCDSVVTTDLTVNPVFAITVDAQVCNGQSFTLPDGSTVSTSGTYPVTLTSVNGCDSVVTTDLSVISVLTTSVDASICNGSSYTLPDGSVVTAAGLYDVTLTSSGGCDSIVTTNLSILPVFTLTVDASICDGDSYVLPDGSSVSAGGQYPVTLSSGAGCDSTITTNLTLVPILSSTVSVSICDGETYFAGGADQTTSGTYIDVLTGINGCDSIVTTDLTVNPVFAITVDAQVCNGQSFTLPDGSTVSTSGTYPVTLTSVNGCDSVVTTDLSVISVLTTSVDASICNGSSYTLPDGSVVTAAGLYDVTLTSSGGCDSIITTNLSILPIFNLSVDASICAGDSFTLPDGSSVSTSGQYAVTLTSSAGCDSSIITNLSASPILNSTVAVSICQGESYFAGGADQTTSGSYLDVFTGSNGCDSIVTTDLTVNPVFAITVDAQVCNGQSFTLPDGSSVNTTGTYPVTLTSVNGCDSVVTTDISVISVLTTSVDASICNGSSYTLPDGSVVTAAGLYDVTLTSSGGCDSIITTNLSILPTFNLSVDASICAGDSFTLPDGSSVSTTGQYAVTLTSSAGCDSSITTNLSVSPILNSTVAVSICQGESYFAGGADQTTSGSYLDVFTGSNGCDSIVTTDLTVNPVFAITVDAQVCNGQSFTLPDGSYCEHIRHLSCDAHLRQWL